MGLYVEEIASTEVVFQVGLGISFEVGALDSRHVKNDGSCRDGPAFDAEFSAFDVQRAVVAVTGEFLCSPGDARLHLVDNVVAICKACDHRRLSRSLLGHLGWL